MECSSHHVSTKALRALILKTIQTVSRYALSNEMEFTRKVREASALQQAQEVKEAKARIRKAQKRCKELDVLIQKLYESYALNKITEKRFDDFLAAYEQEQAAPPALCRKEKRKGKPGRLPTWLKVHLKTKEITDISQPQAGCKAKSHRNPFRIPRLLNTKSGCAYRNRRYFQLFSYTPRLMAAPCRKTGAHWRAGPVPWGLLGFRGMVNVAGPLSCCSGM